MKRIYLLIAFAICILTLSSFIFSDHSTSSNYNNTFTSIDDNKFYYVLDNRYKGGSDAFLALFEQKIKYPNDALENCRVGMSKVNLKVDKDGGMTYELTNPLGFGIDKAVSDFMDLTKSEWKAWNRASELDMTIGFSIVNSSDSYYPHEADLVIKRRPTYKWSTGDMFCASDESNTKKMKKLMKKKKYAKALPYIEEMLRRYPDNEEFKGFLATAK